MKSPADASAHLDGKRHQNGMKIDNSAVKVMMMIFIANTKIHYCPYNSLLDYIYNRNWIVSTQFKLQMETLPTK